MKKTKIGLWVAVALVSSLLILGGGSDNDSLAQAASIYDFAGSYAGYTQSEDGATGLKYSAIHNRTIGSVGISNGKTISEIYSPVFGVLVMTCMSNGVVTILDDNYIEIASKQNCDNLEYELSVTSVCTGADLGPDGYEELYCIDTTVEMPGFEAINTTILKRK